MAAVPNTLDEVTAEWLADGLGVEISAIEVDQIAAGSGFMGQLARVHITSGDPTAATRGQPGAATDSGSIETNLEEADEELGDGDGDGPGART